MYIMHRVKNIRNRRILKSKTSFRRSSQSQESQQPLSEYVIVNHKEPKFLKSAQISQIKLEFQQKVYLKMPGQRFKTTYCE